MLKDQQGISGYQQLSGLLTKQIAAGIFPSGSQLPTEMEISRQYKLNRHTVRRALEVMEQEGLVYRLRGKGTFVAAKKIPYRVSQKTQFTSSILEAGFTPQACLINSYELSADRELAERLEIAPKDKVTVLKILRYADNLPFCFTLSYLPAHKYPGLSAVLPESFSLYQVIKEHFGVEARRVSSTFEVGLPERADSEMLRISPNTPLLIVKSCAKDQHGAVAEFCSSKFRGDYCTITLDFDEGGKKL
ncbi:MAG: phosphonate metabolism transcriptional regulator PhnF [Thermodesulfobacteriota bacterium]